MNIHRAKLLLALLAAFALPASRLSAAGGSPTPSNFFSPQAFVANAGNGYSVYYLSYFNYYAYSDSTPAYIYKFNFGFLYFFDPASGDLSSDEAYFYDFTAKDYFYTSSGLYPYFYSFGRQTFLYYFENSSPRQFYDFKAQAFITY